MFGNHFHPLKTTLMHLKTILNTIFFKCKHFLYFCTKKIRLSAYFLSKNQYLVFYIIPIQDIGFLEMH